MGRVDTQMINELKSIGADYYDTNAIFKQNELSSEEVKIILKWLPEIYLGHLGTGDLLARSLISAKEPFDCTVLIDLFEKSTLNSVTKGGIAVVLSYAKTQDISAWIIDQLSNKDYSQERSALIFGLPQKGGFKDKASLIAFLKSIFDNHYSGLWADVFKKYASKEDISFLEDKLGNGDKKVDREIQKLIEGINKRKRNYQLP